MVTPSPMRGVVELEELDRLFGALSHRTRRAILLVLHANGGAMTSKRIAGRFGCTWQTTSRHLRVLEEAGLVKAVLHSRERFYELEAHRLTDLVAHWLERFEREPAVYTGPKGRGKSQAATEKKGRNPVVPHRYDKELHIDAPPEAVWAALTTPELIQRWFGAKPTSVELHPGGTILFTHQPHGEIVAEVDEAQPPNTLTFRWPVIGPPGERVRPGNFTQVNFDVRDEPGGSVLQLSEVGFDELAGTDNDVEFRYKANSTGWPRMLEALADEARALA